MPTISSGARGTGSYWYYEEKRSAKGGGTPWKVLEFGAMVLQNMFSALNFLQWRHDDDFADRMSYFYTSSFLICMAVVVSFKQFGGRPLECWVPAEFTHSWEAYTEMFCWAQNTYFVPFTSQIPTKLLDREQLKISYYQWVPFFLLIEALMFYMPCLVWRLMNDKSGIRLHDIVTAATEKENIEPDFRSKTIDCLTRHVESCLKFQHALRNRNRYTMHRVLKCLNLRYYESYVTGLYLVCKVLYLANIVANLILLNTFLETDDYNIYGFGVLRCVLVINIFNEKIFILLWLWFNFLLIVTLLDSVYWFSISVRQEDRLRFLLRHLETTAKPKIFRKKRTRETVKRFLKTYIKVDGIFILRMLAVHAGVMFCTELTEALWLRFLTRSSSDKGSEFDTVLLTAESATESDDTDTDQVEHGPLPHLTEFEELEALGKFGKPFTSSSTKLKTTFSTPATMQLLSKSPLPSSSVQISSYDSVSRRQYVAERPATEFEPQFKIVPETELAEGSVGSIGRRQPAQFLSPTRAASSKPHTDEETSPTRSISLDVSHISRTISASENLKDVFRRLSDKPRRGETPERLSQKSPILPESESPAIVGLRARGRSPLTGGSGEGQGGGSQPSFEIHTTPTSTGSSSMRVKPESFGASGTPQRLGIPGGTQKGVTASLSGGETGESSAGSFSTQSTTRIKSPEEQCGEVVSPEGTIGRTGRGSEPLSVTYASEGGATPYRISRLSSGYTSL